MARDPLRSVQMLRQRSVEQARTILGICLKAEADAAERIRALDAAAAQDRHAHISIEDAFRYQDMFGYRMLAVRTERQTAKAILTACQARSNEARTAVAAARSAAEAVDTLICERADQASLKEASQAQDALDDLTGARIFQSKTIKAQS